MQTTVVDSRSDRNSFNSLPSPCWKNVTPTAGRLLAASAVTLTLSISLALCQVPGQPSADELNGQQTGPKSDAAKKPAMQKAVPSRKSGTDSTQDPKAAQAHSLTSMGLEEMLAIALKDNPDIRVAEAKLREAEAELNRIRLEIAQKVMTFDREWAVQKAKIEEYETRAQEAEKLKAGGAISQEDWRLSKVNVQVNRLLLSKLEGELPYLLGRPPLGVPSIGQPTPVIRAYVLKQVTASSLKSVLAELLGPHDSYLKLEADDRTNSVVLIARPETHLIAEEVIKKLDSPSRQLGGRVSVSGELAENLRKILEKNTTLEFVETPLNDAIDFLKDYTAFNIRVSRRLVNENPPLTIHLESVPLASQLQGIEDYFDGEVIFVVRDYGILVTREVPEGAVRVLDYWQAMREQESTKSDSKPENESKR